MGAAFMNIDRHSLCVVPNTLCIELNAHTVADRQQKKPFTAHFNPRRQHTHTHCALNVQRTAVDYASLCVLCCVLTGQYPVDARVPFGIYLCKCGEYFHNWQVVCALYAATAAAAHSAYTQSKSRLNNKKTERERERQIRGVRKTCEQ